MIYSPLEQFTIFEIFTSYLTNFSYFLILSLIFTLGLFYKKGVLISETLSSLIILSFFDTVTNFLPISLKKYLPLCFGIFTFVLINNFLGLIPYSYSITCELLLTLSISLTILLSVTIIGFSKHGLHYFSYFLPSGTPLSLVVLLVFIELISYIAKGLSLGIRLAGNVISGHLLLHIAASFIFKLFFVINILVLLPLSILVVLMGLEVIISFLQAYVFTILFAVYLLDAINLHD